ncbi:hypothetical protein jhhlp_002855 [Lomentospora prolificans]|uniref:Inositol polyphosphate-related phosphatase domain-containing protein n=1 Tax=Lomentospora prolificans TaxID=41688 RepID=A0A2N3NF81_9PEZI|nr:hypothetical protein jhhlp_002855 [Lomentospora prolificans]
MPSDPGPAPSIQSSHLSDPPENAHASTPLSLVRAVYDRRSEYVRPHRLRIKIGSWNVAACPGTDKDLASWFVDGKGVDPALSAVSTAGGSASDSTTILDPPTDEGDELRLVGGDKIGLYVLGLQEIVDLSLAKEAYNRMYSDNNPVDKWRLALEAAMPDGYQLVVAEQMSGILLLIYASPELVAAISDVSTVQVGTGLLGYMGNKGAISSRLVLGETTRLVFINSHLASGAEQTYLDRRCWDIGQVLSRTQFDPVNTAGAVDAESEKIGDEDFAFWFGDLNFRVDGLPGDDIRRLLWLHTQGQYDLSNKTEASSLDEGVIVMKPEGDADEEVTDRSVSPSPNSSFSGTEDTSLPDPDDFIPDPHEDPTSLQATLDSLLPHDQLLRLIKEKKVFHDGWREADITFLPTYKYDVGTVGLFDSSEKQRAPSWCDRVLYRTRRDLETHKQKEKDAEEARKRDEELKARGIDEAAEDDDVLFSYDPEFDGLKTQSFVTEFDYDEYDEGDNEALAADEVVPKAAFTDRIHMDMYTSHQRITSSDHKPVVSIFTLDYDAVVPELKAKVHAEVARELDRAENEGRPNITILVDRHNSASKSGHEPGSHGDAVEFGDVSFLSKQTCSLTVANTGGVPATFNFVDKPSIDEGNSSSKPPPKWLTFRFLATEGGEESGEQDLGKEVTLEPGETATVLLQALVDDITLAQSLNYGRASLEDVLVLRVTGGRDYFVPVHAHWLPTAFCRSIDELIRVPDGGIRSFISQSEPKITGAIPYDRDVKCAAPKELFKLTEALEKLLERALADENMLDDCIIPRDNPGWPFDKSSWKLKDDDSRATAKASLITALDTDAALIPALPVDLPALKNLEILSECLLLFLTSLTDGVIPSSLWPRLPQNLLNSSAGPDIEHTKTSILDVLSSLPNHNISFVFLATTLERLASELSPKPTSAEESSPSRLRGLSFRRVVRSATGGSASNTPVSNPSSSSAKPTESPPPRSSNAQVPSGPAPSARLQTRQKRFAAIFAPAVCRIGSDKPGASEKEKEKERKAAEEKRKVLMEMFMRREL